MERLTAVVVLLLGAVVLLATAVGVALGEGEPIGPRVLVVAVVAVGMWRAATHLRPAARHR